MSYEQLSQAADLGLFMDKDGGLKPRRKKTVRTIQQPAKGFRLRWGRDEPGADEDFCAAWAAGSKQPALTLLNLLSGNRKMLEAAGVDFKTLRVESKGAEMAKVVGRDESLQKKVTCKSCAAIVEYWPDEVERSTGFVMTESETTTYVVCPEEGGCGNRIILSRS